MLGKQQSPVRTVFSQRIRFVGAGPFHFDSWVILRSAPITMELVPSEGFQLIRSELESGSTLFHPVENIEWTEGVSGVIANCLPMMISVGSEHDIKVLLAERIQALYSDRPTEIPRNTKALYEKVASIEASEFSNRFTTFWPPKNQEMLVVYQNVRLGTESSSNPEHFQFRRVIFLDHCPLIGTAYIVDGAPVGTLESVSNDSVTGEWIGFTSPESKSDYEQVGASYELRLVSEEDVSDFVRSYLRYGWDCMRLQPAEKLRYFKGSP
jgi:hypothetical protein